MALLPCAFGRHRYKGRAAHFYLGLLDGVTSERFSLRLCPAHANEVLESIGRFELDQDALEFPVVTQCASCERAIDVRSQQTVAAFLTAYSGGADRVDFYTLFHTECRAPDWASAFRDAATGGSGVGPARQ